MFLGICLLPLAAAVHRDYVAAWGSSFYRYQELQVKHVGLVNAETVFFASGHGVSTLHEGLLTPVIELRDVELTAFAMCHHRGSLFYETLSKEGGLLTIFEYSLLARESAKVAVFQETVPAKALACVDQLLLRSSKANLVAIHLGHEAPKSLLQKFKDEDHLGSLAVAFPADALAHAEVYAVAVKNRSVVRLRLQQDGAALRASSEELLLLGDGSDGPLEEASVQQPAEVAWLHGKLLLADRCSLRQVVDGHVQTLLGSDCSENETLQPAPWASELSPIMGLASESEATAGQMALVLTSHQVIQVVQEETCAEASHDACVQAGCGWASGHSQERHCFACHRLRDWAEMQRILDPCALEAPQPKASYDLAACGCAPIPTAAPKSEGNAMLYLVRLLGFFGSLGIGIAYCYRLYRQRQRRQLDGEIYMPAPNVQFHTFNDHGYVRYDEPDEPFS